MAPRAPKKKAPAPKLEPKVVVNKVMKAPPAPLLTRGKIEAITIHVRYPDNSTKTRTIDLKDINSIQIRTAKAAVHPKQLKELVLEHKAVEKKILTSKKASVLNKKWRHEEVEKRPTALAIFNDGSMDLICDAPC